MQAPHVGILGAGAFGTALAIALGQTGRRVSLWSRDPAQVALIAQTRANAARLPGATLPPSVTTTAVLAEAAEAPILLLAVPTQNLRALASGFPSALRDRVLVVCCKGVETGSGLLPTEVLREVLPGAHVGVLTGPSFAADIARGKPTALTLATEGSNGAALQAALATPNLRLYLSDDPTGAQWGGALKNVIAIAAGLTIGADLGESARAALMTRGFAEISRLASQRGGQSETLWGLSGLGDLVLTCTSEKSRNFRHGFAIGAGIAPDTTQTVEGVMTAHAIADSAVAGMMPVSSMVSALLRGRVTLDEAKDLLLSRPLRAERG